MSTSRLPADFLEADGARAIASARSRVAFRVGNGVSTGHHGEILQGVFEDERGGVHGGLVTLACGIYSSRVTFAPDVGSPLEVLPHWKVKSRRAAELVLRWGGGEALGGKLVIDSNTPVGWGLGSSTSDVIATIRAVSQAIGQHVDSRRVADLAVRAEVASDATMFEDRTVLFAQRNGTILEDFGVSIPALDIHGFTTDARGGLDTLSLSPAQYGWRELECFRVLRGLFRRAMVTQDPRLVAHVATASARINQAYLPKPHFEAIERLVEEVGAIGLQVAHSGPVVGLIFDPREACGAEQLECIEARLEALGFSCTTRFSTR
ncbi:hypothetical protein LZC95_21300 [Pendulispora brunnea]|uniref:GHMP kinase N-terminal domain-containing protein n=1 Tax=Pendulispora brunnea TaxID=2905690 RepID=A0ABZ2KL13_9BACT